MWPFVAAASGSVVLLSFLTRAIAEPTQISTDGTVTTDGETPASPKGLAKGAGLTLSGYALARLGTSEASTLPAEAQLAVMWATRNRAAAMRISIPGLLLHATSTGKGYFGRQSQAGRFASTAQDSTAVTRALGRAVALGVVPDPTRGAQQWDSPQSYPDWTGTSSARADAVEAARTAAGNTKVLLTGVSESSIRFWRPA